MSDLIGFLHIDSVIQINALHITPLKPFNLSLKSSYNGIIYVEN